MYNYDKGRRLESESFSYLLIILRGMPNQNYVSVLILIINVFMTNTLALAILLMFNKM